MNEKKLSVIIPVYNVRDYLDRCINSIVNQTYHDIEILLLDDGSTDGCDEICDDWEKKDNRIRAVHKKNEGLGPTRNLGVRLVTTEYIMFVDSDDWLELDAIEKLLSSAVKNNADIVYMNFYFSYENEDGSMNDDIWIRHYLFDGVEDPKKNCEIIFDTDARMWSKLFRRSLFIDNDINMPAHAFEDFPVMPILALYSEKVCQVHEPLYHYYFKRKDNLIGNANNYRYIADGVKELNDEFKKRGFYDVYKDELQKYIYSMCVFAVNDVPLRSLNNESYDSFLKKFINVIGELVPNKKKNSEPNICIWGSYSNRLICYNLLFSQKQILNHYMFSSISGLRGSIAGVEYKTGDSVNKFRLEMVKKEHERYFFKDEFQNVKYLFVDFLEEVNPVLAQKKGTLTLSEAFIDVAKADGDVIDWNNNDNLRWELWKEDCNKFCTALETKKNKCKVVLVKLFLAEEFGTDCNNKSAYQNVGKINSLNKILEKMYLYFEHRMQKYNLYVINTSEYDNYTYMYSKYGCIPCYYNGKFHSNVANKIEKIIWKEK